MQPLPRARTAGAIVYLAQKRHSSYGRDSIGLLTRSLRLLFANYNDKFRDDVLVFHEGDFTPRDQASIIDGRAPIRFARLPTRYWSMPPTLRINQSTWEQPRFTLGYRHMMRWYATTLWPCMAEMGYEFVMRFDEESFLLSPVRYSFFEHMRSNNLEYGYRMASFESGYEPQLKKDERFHSFIRQYLLDHGVQPTTLLWGCGAAATPADFSLRRCGELFGFYNNWFISRVAFWQRDDVRAFLSHVDSSGVIYQHRWNDLILQSATVQMFMPRAKVALFSDFSYEHSTTTTRSNGSSCVIYGGYAQGTADPKGRAHAQRLLARTCSAPCWRTFTSPRNETAVAVTMGPVAV